MKTVMIIAGIICLAVSVWGAFGDVLGSFPAPDSFPIALTYEAGYLWCIAGYDQQIFYRIKPANGEVVASFPTPIDLCNLGAAWDGTYLYTHNYGYGHSYSQILQLNTTGSIHSSFPVNNCWGGLTWDGAYLWYTGTNPYFFYRITTNGSIKNSFPVPFYPYDPGFDGTYLYCGSYEPRRIYKLTLAGAIVASAPGPEASWPWGCTYDGNDLWISSTYTYYIYRVDNGGSPDVEPASLGRVKAIFK